MDAPLPRRTFVAGFALIVALIVAALPGAVAGSWLGPIESEPLPVIAQGDTLAASRVVIPAARDSAAADAVVRGGVAGVAATNVAAQALARPAQGPQVTGWTQRPATDVPDAKSRSQSRYEASSGGAPGSYAGRNHVWIPALGINRSVNFFSCSSSAYPGDVVYRWGCAGSNNVYLFGHAHSVFKPLHDAYVRGALRKGMQVIYADGAGKVSTYAVSWWRVTTPDKGEFAYAAQGTPSLTLQTCVGAQSQYRLIVRLTKVG
jgi:sortase (surface protein transpeptidase)